MYCDQASVLVLESCIKHNKYIPIILSNICNIIVWIVVSLINIHLFPQIELCFRSVAFSYPALKFKGFFAHQITMPLIHVLGNGVNMGISIFQRIIVLFFCMRLCLTFLILSVCNYIPDPPLPSCSS